MSSSVSLENLPPELSIFLDFISDDDRPTFVLEQSTTPKVVFRNTALNALVAEKSQNSSFLSWVDTLSNVAGDCTAQRPSKLDNLGTFKSRVWSGKRIGGAWTAVFCRQAQHYNHEQAETQQDFWPLEPRETEADELSDTQGKLRQDLERHESDNTSVSESSMRYSASTSDLENGEAQSPLDVMIVDRLLFPHLTPDPWIQFLVNHDWENTAIGSMRTWNPALRQLYSTILSSTEPRVIYWGNDLCMFYNEAAKFVVGSLHPHPLGNPLASVWGAPTLKELTGILKRGIKHGKASWNKKHEFVITRYGFPESAFFDFVFLPIPSPDGHFMGIMNEFTESTQTVLQDNRYEISKALLEKASTANNMQGYLKSFVASLERKSHDVSYAMAYIHPSSAQPNSGAEAMQLAAAFGIEGLGPHVPPVIITALQRSIGEVVVLEQRKNTLPLELAVSVPDVGIVNTACVLPIAGIQGRQLSAIVVLGLIPTRPLNSGTRHFAKSLRDLLFNSAVLFSLPVERRKAQEMATALSQQLEVVTSKAEKSERNFTRMVHDAPIGMCINTSTGYPVYVNDSYLKLLNMSRTDFYTAADSGLPWRNAIFEEDKELIDRTWRASIGNGQPMHVEFRVNVDSSLESRWLEATIQQRYDENGDLVFLYGWLADISPRKMSESLIQERLADALETKRSSENFIDMVSHEMRNPLSSILQLADNVLLSLPSEIGHDQASVLTADARRMLIDTAQTITLCAKHQKNIIDEVLTFSKLDSKLLVLAPERVQAATIVESVLKMVKAELDHAGIQGSIDVHRSYRDLAVDYVLLDPGRLSQVIINLMTNAIKFTQNQSERRITVSLAASRTRPTGDECGVTLVEPRVNRPEDQAQLVSTFEGDTGEDIFLCVCVRDTGCGLTEGEMEHLFHRFSQASPKTYKQYGGSGLGLFISRELVELQGGQVGVYSESGKGSTFSFYIKAARVDAPQETPLSSVPMELDPTPSKDGQTGETEMPESPQTEIQDLHILVVEDNAINQKVMAQQLRKMGCAKVYVADHGLDALSLLSTTTFFEADKLPLSVVLLDVEMPIMDGLTCVRRIRELEIDGEILRHVPVIGITANARTNQIAACIEAGMDEVMTKPFRMPQLIPRILALVDKHKSAD